MHFHLIWIWKTFKSSKSLLLRFPSPDKKNPPSKIFDLPRPPGIYPPPTPIPYCYSENPASSSRFQTKIIKNEEIVYLKLVYFLYKRFIFHQIIALQNYKKRFLFHLKISLHSRDIQTFVFLSSTLFFSVSHSFRGWFKNNLKIYDVINCLNKNLITYFAWYLEKEIGCDIEILSIDRILNTEHFYGKVMQKIGTKS